MKTEQRLQGCGHRPGIPGAPGAGGSRRTGLELLRHLAPDLGEHKFPLSPQFLATCSGHTRNTVPQPLLPSQLFIEAQIPETHTLTSWLNKCSSFKGNTQVLSVWERPDACPSWAKTRTDVTPKAAAWK